MENSRLQQLRRQKELLLQHLEWIDREIDRESGASEALASRQASRLKEVFSQEKSPERALSVERLDVESFSSEQVATDLYTELGPDARGAATDAKRGCLTAAALAFVAFASFVAYLLFWY